MRSFLFQLLVMVLRLTLLEAARWLLSRIAVAHIDAVAHWHSGVHPSMGGPVREQLLEELLSRLRGGVARKHQEAATDEFAQDPSPHVD